MSFRRLASRTSAVLIAALPIAVVPATQAQAAFYGEVCEGERAKRCVRLDYVNGNVYADAAVHNKTPDLAVVGLRVRLSFMTTTGQILDHDVNPNSGMSYGENYHRVRTTGMDCDSGRRYRASARWLWANQRTGEVGEGLVETWHSFPLC